MNDKKAIWQCFTVIKEELILERVTKPFKALTILSLDQLIYKSCSSLQTGVSQWENRFWRSTNRKPGLLRTGRGSSSFLHHRVTVDLGPLEGEVVHRLLFLFLAQMILRSKWYGGREWIPGCWDWSPLRNPGGRFKQPGSSVEQGEKEEREEGAKGKKAAKELPDKPDGRRLHLRPRGPPCARPPPPPPPTPTCLHNLARQGKTHILPSKANASSSTQLEGEPASFRKEVRLQQDWNVNICFEREI